MQPEISRYREQGLSYLMITADSKETIEKVKHQHGLDIVAWA